MNVKAGGDEADARSPKPLFGHQRRGPSLYATGYGSELESIPAALIARIVCYASIFDSGGRHWQSQSCRTRQFYIDRYTNPTKPTGCDFLSTLTGVPVKLVGDFGEDAPGMGIDLLSIASKKNIIWFNIKRHADKTSKDCSISKHVENLRVHVSRNLGEILLGEEKVLVKITFDGYENDPRDVFETNEVRHWMRKVCIECVPRAIALLDSGTFSIAETCCNKIVRHIKNVDPVGSPERRNFSNATDMVSKWRRDNADRNCPKLGQFDSLSCERSPFSFCWIPWRWL